MSLKAVIFDYGGVLTTPARDSIDAWLNADQADAESFSTTLKAWLDRSVPIGTRIHRLETGELTIAEFNELLAAELRSHDGTPVNPDGLLTRLLARMRPDPAMFDLARELVRTAVPSNSWSNTYPRERLAEMFDPVVISSESACASPMKRFTS
jgi:putative hydrolase of the HAD superfamily